MPLCFLSVRPPPPRLIACHVSPVAVRPWPSASAPRQVPAALPSLGSLSLSASSTPPPLTCALHCPHFESCSGCTHGSNLHRPVIVGEAPEFCKTVGVSDFTFDSCKIAHHPKRIARICCLARHGTWKKPLAIILVLEPRAVFKRGQGSLKRKREQE
nr:uncharacterized protein LOC103404198 isoform X2 [Malus domestica]